MDVDEGPLLIEVAWEVARKVGGIYTVLKTKLPFICNIWGNRYALVGVYNYESAATEFEPVEPRPLHALVIENLQRNNPGIKIHYGRWLVPGRNHRLAVCSSLTSYHQDILVFSYLNFVPRNNTYISGVNNSWEILVALMMQK